MGTFYRTIRLVENGIKPVYVFDGKPPKMKSSELEKRAGKREEAQKALEKAEEAGTTSHCRIRLLSFNPCKAHIMILDLVLGDATEIDKFSRRLVKVTSTHTNECKELLKLMGIPYVEVGHLTVILCYDNL